MSGLSVLSTKDWMSTELPAGVDRWVALFTTLPRKDGTGGIEISDAWYARIAHQTWITEVVDEDLVRRKNSTSITFASNSSGAPVTVVGWGVFDEDGSLGNEGTLRAWGPTRSAGGVEQPYTIPDGDTPSFVSFSLQVQSTPTTDETTGMTIFSEGELTTVDATPVVSTIYRMTNEEGVTVKVRVTANGGSADRHYYREIVVSAYHDGAGNLWSLREQTPDGAETRINLDATVTAEVTLAGTTLVLTVTGQAAALTWLFDVEARTDDP